MAGIDPPLPMRTFSLILAFFLALFLGAGLPRSGRGVVAGTAVKLDVSELVRDAELILEAHVLSAHSLRSGPMIETEFMLQVERTFLGEDFVYRTLRLPGGVLEDGSGMLLSGLPQLFAGEHVLCFLSTESASGVRMPVGLAQGTFRVIEGRAGEKRLVRDCAGVALLDATGHARASTLDSFDYAEIVAQIEAALSSHRSR